jgi:hypothetical protein
MTSPYQLTKEENESKYKLGKYNVVQQAFIIFFIGCAITIFVCLSGFYALINYPVFDKVTSLFLILLITSFIFAYTCLVTYITNCLIVGKCNLLAWFYVGFIGVYAIYFALFYKVF